MYNPMKNVPDENETLLLLKGLKQGEDGAWEEFYRRYHDMLLLSIRINLGPKLRQSLESEDIFQSVAMEAFRDLPRFEAKHKGALRHFLHKLVLNKIRDRADTFKAKKRSGAVPLTEGMMGSIPAGNEPPKYINAPVYENLENCLNLLPPPMRQILILRKIDGLSTKEAAKRIGKNEVNTRKIYSRALAKLSALMMES